MHVEHTYFSDICKSLDARFSEENNTMYAPATSG